jgi:CHAT domain-containing protein
MFLAFPDFLFKVNWADAGPKVSRYDPSVPWGPPKRTGKVAAYSSNLGFLRGGVIKLPGITIDQRSVTTINTIEIVRTLAIATRRYGELLGPAAKHDGLLTELLGQLDKRPVPRETVPQALCDVLLGIANRAAGKLGDAPGLLRRGMLVGDAEHPLTPLVLLEQGHLALAEAFEGKVGKFEEAGDKFECATYAAVQFMDGNSPGWPGVCDILEEAFRYGFMAHRLSNARRPFAKAVPAAKWAQRQGWKYLTASLLLNTTESAASLRDTAAAASAMKAAKSLVGTGRAEMAKAKIGARMSQLEALVLYQQGRIKEGDTAFARAMEFQMYGSLWLFHIALAEAINDKPPAGITERERAALYATLLRDPARSDWQLQPLEALSVLVGPRHAPFEHWFELVIGGAERAGDLKAVEIADLTRRHRFFSSLPDGGRLVSLRWLLEAPAEQLSAEAARERRDLLVQFDEYQRLAVQATNLRNELQRLPLAIDRAVDAEAFDLQKKKLAELASVGENQEAILRQIAVDRIHAPLIFPPFRKAKEVQDSLPAGHALLVFFSTSATSKRLYSFLLTRERDKYPTWRVRDPAAAMLAAQKMLREMGNLGENRVVPAAELANNDWQEHAKKVFDELFTGQTKESLPPKLDELVVVPDGALWYVPFEALQVPAGEGVTDSLIRRMPVRYAPTMSLALPDRRGRKSDGNTVVSLGKLMPSKGDAERAKAAFDDLKMVIPSAVALPELLPAAPATYSTLFDQLIVWDDLKAVGSPYNLLPVKAKSASGAALESWLQLPWGGPDQVMLPGFHTAAESSLAGTHNSGADVFLTTCGLMANGSRTVLLSRWRTGGRTTSDLIREFAQDLPQTTAARAWRRSVLLCMDNPIVPADEPRIAVTAKGGPANGSHPFFWSGYLLIDTGTPSPRTAAARHDPKLPPR